MGSAPLGATAVDWWKTPIEPAPANYWVWHKASDRSPFRLVFPFASDRFAPLSRYAMSYQVAFEALPETDLPAIAEVCKRTKPPPARNGARALRRLLEAMPRAQDRADAEIRRLMPALDLSCSAAPFPEWPEKLAITGVMTPIDSARHDQSLVLDQARTKPRDTNASARRTRRSISARSAKAFPIARSRARRASPFASSR